MGQKCKVCQLPPETRKQLETEYIQGVSIHRLYKKYGMTDGSIQRHVESHLPQKLIIGSQKQLESNNANLLQRVEDLHRWLKPIIERSYEKGHFRTTLKAVAETRNVFQLTASMVVELHKIKALEAQNDPGVKMLEHDKLMTERISRLTPTEQKLYYQLLEKMLDDNATIDIDYTTPTEHNLPRRKRRDVVEEEPEEVGEGKGKEVGASEDVERSKLENTPPEPETESQPEYERHGMTFKPITEWDGKTDARTKLSRTRFARAIEDLNDDDPYSSPVT